MAWQVFFFAFLVLNFNLALSQGTSGWQLEKMPEDLEMDFAKSALPTHLRENASVYLLDPNKGYYLAHKGTNGFICLVIRTEWERSEFRNDLASPISYDAEGAKLLFPVFEEAAAMRATGKYSMQQIKDKITDRFNKGVYKAPKPGISYMLSPMMRTYDDAQKVVTMSVPHYMFYAPYLTAADLGCSAKGDSGPVILGDGKSPHGFALMFTRGEEKAKILEENKQLIKRLGEYKAYFKVDR